MSYRPFSSLRSRRQPRKGVTIRAAAPGDPGAWTIRRRNTTAGITVVEFAFYFPVFVLIASFLFQLGYGLYICQRLESSIQGAARYAALTPSSALGPSPSPDYVQAVQNYAVYGSPAGGATPVIPGLSPGQVQVSVAYVDGRPDCVTVQVSNFIINGVFGPVAVSRRPVATSRFAGGTASL